MTSNAPVSSKPSKSSGAPAQKKTPQAAKRQIHPIIEIVNGSKHYGFCGHWQQVLWKFNMTVYKGEVYALLGPYGCGKSTVLNVILGFKTLNLGQVTIFGFKPGHKLSGIPGVRVGYTPQSSGLYPEFTVAETLRYYGALLTLNRTYVLQRIEFLTNLLSLPHDKQYVKHCTAGTKRQISFAVALLHEPELLILDEPCAGMDPVLRRNMWEHMRQLAKEDKTILVTTQNCEEGRMADKVGFMRNGHLLIEGNPKELLRVHNEKQLESLYRRVYSLNLSIKRSNSVQENPLIKLEPLSLVSSEGFMFSGSSSDSFVPKRPQKPNHSNGMSVMVVPVQQLNWYCLSFRRLRVLVARDFILAIRSYIWLFLFLVIPSIFLIIFCITIGTTPSSLLLAVVNHEATDEDCLTNHDYFMSCQVLDLIDPRIVTQIEYKSDESAWRAARNSDVSGILVIQKHFSVYINKALSDVLLGKRDPNVEHIPMELSLDVTSRIVASTIESTIKAAIEGYLQTAVKGTLVEASGLGYPLKMGSPIFGTQNTTDTDYMAPGLAITFIYHSAAFIAAITLVTSRVHKLTQRDYLAGVRLQETIVAQLIIYGFITLIQAVMLFVVLLAIFHMPNDGELLYIALVVVAQIWCGISFGVSVAMICQTNVGAGLSVFGCLVATLILCGIQWPLNGLPHVIHLVIEFLPQTKSIEAIRNILQKGTSISHQSVWCGIAAPLCWFIIFTVCYNLLSKIS